jgi:hypothetical protein
MSENNKIQKFAQKTYKNPITQATLTAIDTLPIIGAFTASSRKAMEQVYANAVEERRQAFFDELEKGAAITSEMLETEEFIHSVFVTYSAAMRTYQRDKIRRFAHVLLTAIEKDELASDKFEEYMKILDSLSERELAILIKLHKYESLHPHIIRYHEFDNGKKKEEYLENDLQRANGFWDKFVIKIEEELDIEREILASMLTGLSRTGLYETFTGSYLNYEGGKGKTTTLFKAFSEWIKLENEKLNTDS